MRVLLDCPAPRVHHRPPPRWATPRPHRARGASAAYKSALTLRSRAGRGYAPRRGIAWQESDPADSLYKAARSALNKRQYKTAADLFRQVRSRYPRSAYVPDTYYYEAFALYRTGSNADLRQASSLLETQQSKYPKAATSGDARALMSRIDAQLAKKGDAEAAERVSTMAQMAGEPLPPQAPVDACSGDGTDCPTRLR